MIHFGFLVPRSTLYPSLSFELIDGLKAGLAHRGLKDITLSIEYIGFGIESGDVYEKAQKLLFQGVDAVIGFIGRRLGDELAPLFGAANRLLLVLDPLGSVLPGSPSTSQPVFYHSLHTCLGTWLAAHTAATEQGPRCILATSFYEAGYPTLQNSAQQSLIQAGGQTAQYFVSTHQPEKFTLAPLQPTLANSAASALIGLFCGDLGTLFLKQYQQTPNRVPAYVSPFLLEEQWLSTVDSPVENITGYVAWGQHLDRPENHTFREAMHQIGRKATIFSMLAWEGGLILADWRNNSTLTDFSRLPTMQVVGPRGLITFDPSTHYSFGPFYQTSVITDSAGTCALGALRPYEQLDIQRTRWLAQLTDDPMTGWRNQYLCI